ncbi:hypothetical protein BC629DRAFT_1591605 [Irpex lacteus]|nr:hypothetical protein BC629DRAFT_1591605 [Irpex lacteus]
MWLPSFSVSLSLLGFAAQAPLAPTTTSLQQTTMVVPNTTNFAFKEAANIFSPKDLIELERPGNGVANPAGDLLLVSVSKYSTKDKKNNKYIYIAPIESTAQPFEIPLAKGGDAFWLDARTIAHAVPEGEGKEKVVALYAISVKYETESIATPDSPLLIGKFPTDSAGNFIFNGKSDFLVFSDNVHEDGDIRAVKKHDEEWENRGDSAFVYEETFDRQWDAWVGPKKSALFSVELTKGPGGKWVLGEEYVNLLEGTGHHAPVMPFGGTDDFDVSATHVVYTAKDPDLPKAWHTKQNIYIVALDGKSKPKELTSGKQGATHAPVFSQKGDKVAWIELDEDGYESDRGKVVIYDLEKDVRYTLTEEWDRSAVELVFSNDDKTLYLVAGEHARNKIFSIPIPATPSSSSTPLSSYPTPKALTNEGSAAGLQVLPNDRLLFTKSSFTSPNDVFVIRDLSSLSSSSTTSSPKIDQLTKFAADALKGKQLDAGDEFWFDGVDQKIQGWVLKPPGFKRAGKGEEGKGEEKKWPLLFWIHGGPQGVWGDQWSTRWNPNVFAQQGYVVVAINPTGSTTFGQKLTDAIQREWGGKPFEDLIRGYKYILDAYPEIDPERAVAGGGSYGGYAINWILGHPEFGFNFKALFCHDGAFDVRYVAYSTDELFFANREWGGRPWEPEAKEVIEKFNPVNFVQNWKTPTLIVHGSKDYRLAETEGLAAFHALQQLKVPSRLVIFPDENHWTLNHGNSLKWHWEVLRWFDKIWRDERLYPAYVAAASFLAFVVHAISSKSFRRLIFKRSDDTTREEVAMDRFSRRAQRNTTIFAFKVARLVTLVALLALTGVTACRDGWAWFNVALASTSCSHSPWVYAAILGTLNAFTTVKLSTTVSFHLSLVSLATFAVYVYRDIWPLMTFTLHPADEAEGNILWAKVVLAFLAGVVLPGFEPYPYIPVDPSEPLPTVNPAQTASLFSFIFYSFLDPIVIEASRVEHLSRDRLPPLADRDSAENLIKDSYRYLDPFSGAAKRHLFFGLVTFFRRSLLYQAICLLFVATLIMAAPVGTNRLLAYLETGGEGAIVKPWVWILLIGTSAINYTLIWELYMYLSTQCLVRTESIVTSLILDHALRIRLKAETHRASDSEGRTESEPEEATKKAREKDNFIGRINNLITSDLDNIVNGRDFLFLVISAPLHIIIGMWFLYVVLGWCSFVGLAVMIVLAPVPTWIATLTNAVQKQKMRATDARVQDVTEMMSMLRMIKLFGWEHRVETSIAEKREGELKWIWRRKLLGMLWSMVNQTIPLVHMAVTYGVYTLVQKKPLSASIVYSSWYANVSLGRIADFLYNTELLDSFEPNTAQHTPIVSEEHQDDIGFGHADFSWSNNSTNGTLTPSRQHFRLHIDKDVIFKKGAFNLILGPTGSGKTSVLMALLGEMHYIPTGPGSWVNLPRNGGVAYAAQESWVQNETIRENILFGSPFDEERYAKVIYQCGLARDLSLFEAGDSTEVGEKGITLSGGQKARVTLARAVYSPAEILLLDDVLAALDVHTARWIVDKCFKGDLLRSRTILLVTHNIAMAGPLANFVVSLDTDGHVVRQGSFYDAIARDSALQEEVRHEEEAVELDKLEDSADDTGHVVKKDKGKLVVSEEIAHGQVSWQALKLFLSGLGGSLPIIFWIGWIAGLALCELLDVVGPWWVGYWARQYAATDPSTVPVFYYLSMYCLITFMVAVSSTYADVLYTLASLRASRVLHSKLVSRLLGSTFRWLDVTPVSRVIARCTQDIQSIDGQVADTLKNLTMITLKMLMKLAGILLYIPMFIVPSIVFSILGGILGNTYLKAQMSVKREMSNAKAPVIGVLGGAISGLVSIRAYAAQSAFKDETHRRVNSYVRTARVFYDLNRWVSVRIDALASIFTAAVAFYIVYGETTYAPSSVGFVLAMAIFFSELILWWVSFYNEFEVNGNSLERIHQYVVIEQEPEPKQGRNPPAYWPSSGKLVVEKLTARYSHDGPKVLDNISFRIDAGERVGIVGRTGSGKSTLTLALLRCIYTEGTVIYDNIPTDTLNLDALRSKITIIPQIPELLSGTLRHNLDVFGQYDDGTLNDALRAAGLSSLQRLSDENRMTLDTEISSGGNNLSIGQRQITALARAIVRQSKLLILDEATSAIDYETDAVIQESLRKELKSDVTVITIAHRLQTIMDSDKVIVLDAGRLVEFDSPRELLKRESLLRALVDESADKEALYAIAQSEVA